MAESGTFYLEIITPERQFYIGTAEALVLPAVDGEMGIYPGHEPVVTAIEPGELRYKTEGKWEPAAVGAGFAEVKPDYVILLVGFAEHPEEIDRKRAEAAKKRAEERLRQMAEVYTTSVSRATLDECPMAYKGMQDILDNIGPTAEVVKILRPIYNFKAGDEE